MITIIHNGLEIAGDYIPLDMPLERYDVWVSSQYFEGTQSVARELWGATINKLRRTHGLGLRWRVFRPNYVAGPAKLPMNPIYSQPLPLP